MTEFERMVMNVFEDRMKEQIQRMIGVTLGPGLEELNGLKDRVGGLERKLSSVVSFTDVPPYPVTPESEEDVDFGKFTGAD